MEVHLKPGILQKSGSVTSQHRLFTKENLQLLKQCTFPQTNVADPDPEVPYGFGLLDPDPFLLSKNSKKILIPTVL